jgi:hypothetical protein
MFSWLLEIVELAGEVLLFQGLMVLGRCTASCRITFLTTGHAQIWKSLLTICSRVYVQGRMSRSSSASMVRIGRDSGRNSDYWIKYWSDLAAPEEVIVEGRADQLLEEILAGANDSAANQLLTEFLRGYPIARLRLLLQSDEESALRAGAWIASELGKKIAPLVDEVSRMLSHSSRYVRFFLLDALLGGATNEDGQAIARAVLLIRDPDRAVRWKVLNFLARAPRENLAAAVPYLGSALIARSLTWLLEADDAPRDRNEVLAKLGDHDPVVRMFAAAAAARLGQVELHSLEHAAGSTDPEVRSFAEEQLEALRNRRSQ